MDKQLTHSLSKLAEPPVEVVIWYEGEDDNEEAEDLVHVGVEKVEVVEILEEGKEGTINCYYVNLEENSEV